jgi:hypothetical protein
MVMVTITPHVAPPPPRIAQKRSDLLVHVSGLASKNWVQSCHYTMICENSCSKKHILKINRCCIVSTATGSAFRNFVVKIYYKGKPNLMSDIYKRKQCSTNIVWPPPPKDRTGRQYKPLYQTLLLRGARRLVKIYLFTWSCDPA